YGRALQAALREALVSLRPPSSGASLVALRYLDGLTPPMVFRRLGISRSEYCRQHDRCVAELAEMLSVRWTTTTGFATVPRGGPRPQRLIGRDEDMAAVRAILDEYRLVTISGPGGVGKTRLAFELADACQSDGAVTVIDLTDVPEAVRVA